MSSDQVYASSIDLLSAKPFDLSSQSSGSSVAALTGELPPAPVQREEGTLESALIGVGSGMNRVMQEGKKIGSSFLEKNFLIPQGSTQTLSDEINQERSSFDATPVGDSAAGNVGQFIGEVLPTLVVPGGVTGGILKRIASGAAAGGVAGSMAPTDSAESFNEDRVVNTLVGTAFGASIPALIGVGKAVASKVGEFSKGFRPSSAVTDLSKSVTREEAKAALESSRRLDTFMTPGEATNFGEIITREGSLRLDDPSLKVLGTSVRKRNKVLRESVDDLVKSIAPDSPERAQLITEGYEALSRTKMLPNLIKQIADDPTLGPEYTKFLRAKGFKEAIVDIPENSFSRLDHFNEFLNERSKQFYTTGRSRAGRQVNNKRKELQNFVDLAVPEYGIARREAQLNIIKKDIIKGMSKIKGSGIVDETGVPVPDAVQFYQKFLKSGEAYDDLVFNLADNATALEKIADLRTVLSKIESSPLKRLFKAAPEPTEGIRTIGLKEVGLALTEALRVGKGRYSKAMLELITDPAWDAKILENAAALSSKAATSAQRAKAAEEFTRIMTRVIAKDSTARQSSETAPITAPPVTVE